MRACRTPEKNKAGSNGVTGTKIASAQPITYIEGGVRNK